MNLQHQINIVLSFEKTKAIWRNNHISKEWLSLDKLSSQLLGEGLGRQKNCGCIDDFYTYIHALNNNKNYLNQKQKQMSNESKFALKQGAVLMSYGTDALTNDNLTDKKAIEVLSRNPKCIVHFVKFPNDWKSLLKKGTQFEEEVEETTEEGDGGLEAMTLNELREMYPDIKATSKKAFLAKIKELEQGE